MRLLDQCLHQFACIEMQEIALRKVSQSELLDFQTVAAAAQAMECCLMLLLHPYKCLVTSLPYSMVSNRYH